MYFTGNRIRLRKMTQEDAPIYHQWRNDLEVMQFTNPSIDVYAASDTENFVEQMTQSSTSRTYIIEDKQADKPIGVTSLIHLDYKNQNAECIIDIGEKEYWSQGYGKEAFQLLLNYAFGEMNLHRLYLKVFSFNERAIKLYEKLGFEKEGALKEALYHNHSWHDIVIMGLLKGHYLRRDT